MIKQQLLPGYKPTKPIYSQNQSQKTGKVRRLEYTEMAKYLNENKDRRKNQSIAERMNEETKQILNHMLLNHDNN